MRDWLPGCRATCDALEERYGFAAAEIETLSPEIYVRYHRGERTISICFERGLPPIVELFYPAAETGEAALPWALLVLALLAWSIATTGGGAVVANESSEAVGTHLLPACRCIAGSPSGYSWLTR